MESNMETSRSWNAGCGESYLSGVGSAGRKPTVERQQGAVLRLHLPRLVKKFHIPPNSYEIIASE